ncbi:hypothetical protein MASR2M78_03330 [Treponema sp.]
MENKRIQTWFFGALFLFLFIAVARIFTPFFTVILWSVLLYILFSPLYHRILKHIDRSRFWGRILRSLLAGIFSVVSVVAIVLPLGFVALQLARQVSILAKGALAFLESHPTFLDKELNDLATSVKELSLGSISLSASDLKQALAQGLSGGMQTVIKLSTLVLKNVGAFFLGLVFMVFSLFFLYGWRLFAPLGDKCCPYPKRLHEGAGCEVPGHNPKPIPRLYSSSADTGLCSLYHIPSIPR